MRRDNNFKRTMRRMLSGNSFFVLLLACLASVAALACGAMYLTRQDMKSDDWSIPETSENAGIKSANSQVETTQDNSSWQKETEDFTDEEDWLDDEDEEDDEDEMEDDKKKKNEEETTAAIDSEYEEKAEEQSEQTVQEAAANIGDSLSFSAESILSWPVSGNILLEYNMDNTIYFPTLNIYKCNPAVVIQADVNTPVKSSAEGVIKEIASDEERGMYMVVDIGDNYELTYGQIKNPTVEVGQVVGVNDTLGYIAEPTKYYTTEGYNLYFQMTHNGDPIDPLDYFIYE